VAVTELDVRIEEPENSTNLAAQSEVYKNTTGACMLTDALCWYHCLGFL
jgi:endo-1,4-beta-xylanase